MTAGEVNAVPYKRIFITPLLPYSITPTRLRCRGLRRIVRRTMLPVFVHPHENEIEPDQRCHYHDEKKQKAGGAEALVSGAGSLPFGPFLN